MAFQLHEEGISVMICLCANARTNNLTPLTAVGPLLKRGCWRIVETSPLKGSSYLTDTARGGRDAASPAAFCFIDKGSRPDAEQVRELGEYYKEGPPFGKRTL